MAAKRRIARVSKRGPACPGLIVGQPELGPRIALSGCTQAREASGRLPGKLSASKRLGRGPIGSWGRALFLGRALGFVFHARALQEESRHAQVEVLCIAEVHVFLEAIDRILGAVHAMKEALHLHGEGIP